MAIFHLDTYAITNQSGIGSGVAAAAYRSGTALRQFSTLSGDARTLKRLRKAGADRSPLHDYTKRHGVVSAELIFPEGQPPGSRADREEFWNHAESINTRKNSRVAREFRVALPHEMSTEQRRALVLDIAQQLVDQFQCVADVAVHLPSLNGDQRGHHAHIMTTTNKWEDGALGKKTDLELSNRQCAERDIPYPREQIIKIRQMVEKTTNKHLAAAGLSVRVDCRSLRNQNVPIRPCKSVSLAEHHIKLRGAANDNQTDQDSAISNKLIGTNVEFLRSNPSWITERCRTCDGELNAEWVTTSLSRYVPHEHKEYEGLMQFIMADGEILEATVADAAAGLDTDNPLAHTPSSAMSAPTLAAPRTGYSVAETRPNSAVDEQAIFDSIERTIYGLSSLSLMVLQGLRDDPKLATKSYIEALIAQFAECFTPDHLADQLDLIVALREVVPSQEAIKSLNISGELRRISKAIIAVSVVIEEAIKICPDELPEFAQDVEPNLCSTQRFAA